MGRGVRVVLIFTLFPLTCQVRSRRRRGREAQAEDNSYRNGGSSALGPGGVQADILAGSLLALFSCSSLDGTDTSLFPVAFFTRPP